MAQPRRTIQPSRRSPTATSREWVGGRFSAPFHITGEAQPYRPTLVIWIEAPEWLVVGHGLDRPTEGRGALGRALADAMQSPLVGPARRPSAIRVSDADLAAEVKAVVGDLIPVTVAATPELDELVETMFESFSTRDEVELDGKRGGEEESYLENGRVSPEVVADLFTAARILRRVAPWTVASDQHVLRLDIPDLGVEGACVSIIGSLEENLGLLIFPSLAGFEAFLKAASTPRRKSRRRDVGTSWLSFTLVPAAKLEATMRREVKVHGWPVADEESYPLVEHRDADLVLRPLVEQDVRIATACATSLATFFMMNREAFETDDCEPICQSFTDDRDQLIRFTLPYEAFPLFGLGADPEPASADFSASPVGRNDSCPCGSGKKYKHCHLGEDRARK